LAAASVAIAQPARVNWQDPKVTAAALTLNRKETSKSTPLAMMDEEEKTA